MTALNYVRDLSETVVATAHGHRDQALHGFWYCCVVPLAFRAPPGPAAVCAGGRRPAREPSAPRASLGASARSPARPRRRPPAPPPTGSTAWPSRSCGALHAGRANPLRVAVRSRFEVVSCPKCRPPRRKTLKTGCYGRGGLRFGQNCLGHGVLFAREPAIACANRLYRT